MDHSSPNTQEDELALLIQDGQASDRLLNEMLVRNYAAQIYRLALAVLDGSPNVERLAREVTKTTFAQALDDPDSIRGYDDISSWLYAIAIRTLQTHHKHFLRGQVFLRFPFSPPEAMAGNFLRQTVHALSPKYRLPVILRYGFNLPLEQIAMILALPEEKIHSRLNLARRKISACFDPPLYLPTHRKARSEQTRLLAALDGLTPPEEIPNLKAHMADCPDCQAFGEAIHQLEDRLSHILQTWWPPPTLDEQKIQEIIAATENERPNDWRSNLAALPAKEIAWIGVVTALFFFIIRFASPFLAQPNPPEVPTSTPNPTLPTPVVLQTIEDQLLEPDLTASSRFLPGQFPGNPIWKLGKRIKSGEGPVTSLAFSPDGRLLAAGFGDQVIRVWGYPNEAGLTDLISHRSQISSLAFSPDSRFLASGSADGEVIIWNTWNGKVLFTLDNHPDPISSLAFSPDGKFLAVGTSQAVWLWDVGTEAFIRTRRYFGEKITDITISPDSKLMAAADGETVWVRNIPAGDLLVRFRNQKDKVLRIRFSPDGQWLASASLDGTVVLTHISKTAGGQYRFDQGFSLPHTSPVTGLAFAPDGKGLATVTEEGNLLFWDTRTGKLSYPHTLDSQHQAPFQNVAYSPDGNTFASSIPDGTIFLWELNDLAARFPNRPTPKYFRREPDNQIPIKLVIPDILSQLSRKFPLDFWSLESLTPFNLSPFRDLPASYAFRNAKFDPETRTVTLHYVFEPWKYRKQTPTIYVRIQPVSDQGPESNQPLFTDLLEIDSIGASALVETIPLGSRTGEFVKGQWVLTPQDNPFLETLPPGTHNLIARWLPEGVLRLRWQEAGFLVEIVAIQVEVDPGKKIIGQKEILQLVNEVIEQEARAAQFQYTIQAGDTCIQIANRFGTSVSTLAQINGISNCDLIYAGDTLLIPLPRRHTLVTETDLDCNGETERILIIPDPANPNSQTNFGVIVESLSSGQAYPATQPIYWPLWQLTIADVKATYFSAPELFSVGGCEKFIAINLRGDSFLENQLKIFRWDGANMVSVLDVAGLASNIAGQPQNDGSPFTIEVTTFVGNPATDSCTSYLVHYAWNGNGFERVEPRSSPGASCGRGYP